ncbi:MAG: hypothetical protein RLZZ591_1668 [Pseudomonadota bacterium]|jgi:hypothetical protein
MKLHKIPPTSYGTCANGCRFASSIALVLAMTACASAPNLSDAGARLQAVSADQAKACKFVRVVQFNDRILGMGKDPTVMRAIGETNLRNAVAATGADTFVVTRDDSNWFMGSVSYEAQAYRCGG